MVSGGTYAKVPNGTVGKIIAETSRPELIMVKTLDFGECNLHIDNLMPITKKEYFIKALRNNG